MTDTISLEPYPTVTRTYDGHHDFRPDLDPDVLDLEYDLASPHVQAKQLLNDHDLLGSLVYNLSELSLSSRSFSSTVISKVYRKNLFYNDTSVHYDPSGQGSSYNQSLELDHDHDEDHRSRCTFSVYFYNNPPSLWAGFTDSQFFVSSITRSHLRTH